MFINNNHNITKFLHRSTHTYSSSLLNAFILTFSNIHSTYLCFKVNSTWLQTQTEPFIHISQKNLAQVATSQTPERQKGQEPTLCAPCLVMALEVFAIPDN